MLSADVAQNVTQFQGPLNRARSLWRHDYVTHDKPERRTFYRRSTDGNGKTDATGLTFPLQMVIMIILTTITAVSSYYLADSRAQGRIAALESDIRINREQIDAQRRDYEGVQRRVALNEVRIDETRVLLAEIKGLLTGSGIKGAVTK